MYYKISPIIITLLVAIIILVIGFGVKMFIGNPKNIDNTVEQQTSNDIPVLELNTNTNEENQEYVIITANATTQDEAGIYAITLPDGKIVRSDTATYEVVKNGNYTFKVKGNNGQSSSLTFEVNNIREASDKNPYMPTGFSHVGGDVETGYVIQDRYGNEYVWVPVADGKLIRNTMLDSNYEESNSTASELVNSVAKNYGFYIARYEASAYEVNGEKIACSLGNKSPWTNVNYTDALSAGSKSASFFEYDGYKTTIMNSYAWDTTINWIDQSIESYSSSTGYGNYSGNIRNTGTTESDIKNNICDMAGNVREWTTEVYKISTSSDSTTSSYKNKSNEEVVSETVTYRVVRGGSANLSRTAASHTGYKQSISDAYWGFRMILYK